MQSPNQMKCVYIESINSEPLIKTIPIPTLQSGQLLIKVDYAPINISDIKFMQGKHNSQKTFPCVPGFEGSGQVVLTGGGIGSWGLSGKRVAFYTENQFGSYAEFCIADSQFCFELEENCKNQEGACSFINPMMVLAMLEICKNNNAKAVINNVGASQIGKMMNRYFKNNGIQVINIVRRQEQVKDLNYENQENFVLFQEDEDLENKLKLMIQATQASIYFDAIGAEWTGKILSLMPAGSKVYCYGQLSQQTPSTINTKDLIFNRKSIKGFQLNQWIGEQNYLSIQIILRKLKQLNRTDLKTVIAKEFPLIDIIEAIQYYESNMSLGKVLIRPSKQFEQMVKQKKYEQDGGSEDNQYQISGDAILQQHEQL